MKPKYKRILLKLSGEGLAGAQKTGIDADIVKKLAAEIAQVTRMGVQVCLVVGGGNFFRGAKNAAENMDRSVADHLGMIATVMNALTIQSALQGIGCQAQTFSGLAIPQVCRTYNFAEASEAVQNNVLIFAGGTGCPYFTTDTGAVLRALEMHCDILMKATQVDGVYSDDPRYNPEAVRYDEISYDEVIGKQLKVMDMSAIAIARDNKLPVMVFSQQGENTILQAVCGKVKCTIIK
ncbi:MAG: UMP kinase [Alphaproteobacteria bacterium]|nr:UMP kinase [Alphaproteobacteria bacterium]